VGRGEVKEEARLKQALKRGSRRRVMRKKEKTDRTRGWRTKNLMPKKDECGDERCRGGKGKLEPPDKGGETISRKGGVLRAMGGIEKKPKVRNRCRDIPRGILDGRNGALISWERHAPSRRVICSLRRDSSSGSPCRRDKRGVLFRQ